MIYNVVARLVALRDLLAQSDEPIPFGAIVTALPSHYDGSETSRRLLRRDIKNLEALGTIIERRREGYQGEVVYNQA